VKRALFAAACAGVVAIAIAFAAAQDGGGRDEAVDPLAAAVAAGRTWRLDTANGPVHVWVPAGYHADGAATVVYVHGYYTDIDKAWVDHRLPQQFALSGVNALFIAPEAPSGSRQKLHWPSLADLLVEVQRATGVTRPMGVAVWFGGLENYSLLSGHLVRRYSNRLNPDYLETILRRGGFPIAGSARKRGLATTAV
jgi:hypothetical protein